MKENKELQTSLNKVMGDIFINHEGLLVNKQIGGYVWSGLRFTSLDDLDKHIRNVCEMVGKNELGDIKKSIN